MLNLVYVIGYSIAVFITANVYAILVIVERVLPSAVSRGNFGKEVLYLHKNGSLTVTVSLPAHHGCTAPCHAPASCSEDEPCQSSITLKCPCGRIQQPSLCGRSASNPTGREVSQQIRCTNECAIAKRNARLAEALGISADVKAREGGRPVTYSDELVAFARGNAKFVTLVEKTLAEYVCFCVFVYRFDF